MSAAAGLAQLAARAGAVQVALGLDGKAVTAKQDIRSWSGAGATLRTQVSFGPYAESVEASQVLIWVGDAAPEVLALSGTLGLPPGVPFLFDLDLTVS